MAVKKVEKTEKVVKPKAVKVVKPKAEKVVKVAKKVVKKEIAPKIEKEKVAAEPVVKEKVAKKIAGVYFYAVGRRKTSVAQVRLYENDKATENDIIINDKKLKDYFPTISLQNNLLSPLKAVGMHNKFSMTVLVRGGGVTGQVEAVRLGIARALVVFNAELKKTLKDLGLMTRDAREVERKKAGLKKARKAPQWAKR
ncbi:MAG: 30S ribosomal protein S9 [Candidatus Moranbacteria bacterium GW2011_GWC2_37_73]|nr:MAG: 30S ribosomal protein S9 [Parcubacteria group bacterium GW2011_GWC1_36_108]KKQ01159.1 MAG: 30S ribosomal protein S9 [Candidatus Moranbacteria bacterium GW2011_GWD2_36_198]KKQ39932.1 MAG: 30S ribosomal protein S9 [Candidatus Moranbacteria bacterium GW2011_GWC2_37_73]HAR99681.1 30S ribosomal protein S9 [Candidatus Moranbacteria bacterium]HBI50904.1 30S ribosomal protein S9 [Candidatus Moranbacteria bacterium]